MIKINRTLNVILKCFWYDVWSVVRSSGIFDGVKIRTVINHAWKPNMASELDRQFSDSCAVMLRHKIARTDLDKEWPRRLNITVFVAACCVFTKPDFLEVWLVIAHNAKTYKCAQYILQTDRAWTLIQAALDVEDIQGNGLKLDRRITTYINGIKQATYKTRQLFVLVTEHGTNKSGM